jgi:Bacterial mobilisation protein (MobC)
MGRPKKPEVRDRQLNLSLTQSEFERIKQRAEAVGMRPIHFARGLLLDSSSCMPTKRKDTSSVDRLVYVELGRLGNNLNQISRHLNRTGDPLPADLEPLLNDIRQILARRHRDDR